MTRLRPYSGLMLTRRGIRPYAGVRLSLAQSRRRQVQVPPSRGAQRFGMIVGITVFVLLLIILL